MHPVGTIFFVSYGEVPPCVHTRLLLAHVEDHDYAIATPDMDVYVETIHPNNPNFTSCVQSTANGGYLPVSTVGMYMHSPRWRLQIMLVFVIWDEGRPRRRKDAEGCMW